MQKYYNVENLNRSKINSTVDKNDLKMMERRAK